MEQPKIRFLMNVFEKKTLLTNTVSNDYDSLFIDMINKIEVRKNVRCEIFYSEHGKKILLAKAKTIDSESDGKITSKKEISVYTDAVNKYSISNYKQINNAARSRDYPTESVDYKAGA